MTGSASALALHGGCGTLHPSLLSEADWAEARAHIAGALRAGWQVIAKGGLAVGAVEATVIAMENSPHFNAGHGAALTEAGVHELDASIMDGANLAGGAVCGVRRIRNPITAARAVMEHGDCVLLAGTAADAFAEARGLKMVENGYFTTERRVAALASLKSRMQRGTIADASEAEKHGTVGAVALDRQGNLAAATSTGGYNNKPSGRVGDTPILGAGTYARNGVCAVSCTGQGEVFIRRVVAYDIAARMTYTGASLESAARTIVEDDLKPYKIGAGLVAIDAQGRVTAPFNTLGMYRGWIGQDHRVIVATHTETFDMGGV